MEKKKVRMGFTALSILGIVFTILGGIFLTVGILLLIFVEEKVLPLPFLLIGLLFFLAGVSMLLVSDKKRRGAQQALDGGSYFFGEIVEMRPDYSVRVNGRCPSCLVAQMTDPYGKIHVFKSRNFLKTGIPDLVGQQVRIYAVQGDLNRYYVDIDPLLSNVVEH